MKITTHEKTIISKRDFPYFLLLLAGIQTTDVYPAQENRTFNLVTPNCCLGLFSFDQGVGLLI
jgi:hypothetical protein